MFFVMCMFFCSNNKERHHSSLIPFHSTHCKIMHRNMFNNSPPKFVFWGTDSIKQNLNLKHAGKKEEKKKKKGGQK